MMYIDFIVWEWFNENKLNKTQFQFLPLEILTKIWKLKRKYENMPIKIFLKNHLIYKRQGQARKMLYFSGYIQQPYINENKIHIQQDTRIDSMGYKIQEVTFSKYIDRITRSIGDHFDFPIPITSSNNEDEIILSRAMSRRKTIFSFSVVEDDFSKEILFENFTEEIKNKRYNVFYLKK